MFGFFMDITKAHRKLKVNVISQGQVWGLGLEMEGSVRGNVVGLTLILYRESSYS